MSNMTRFKLLFILLSFLICSTRCTKAKDVSYYGKQPLSLPEDVDYHQFIDGLQTMLKSGENRPAEYPQDMDLLNEYRKRQIRYHPCYFNPVSCFRKKK